MLILRVINLEAGYKGTTILRDVSFDVQKGMVVSIVGANGAGKTTLMRAIVGMIKPTAGEIVYQGKAIQGLPTYVILKKGITMVPEGRRIFGKVTVYENLLVGAYSRTDKAGIKRDIERMYEMFPILAERRNQKAGTFSGGEQQMLAIARGLMSNPQIFIMDEPSWGLSPLLAHSVLEIIAKLRNEGLTILLVEQNVQDALNIADYAILIQNGKVFMRGTGKELLSSDLVRKAYLGI